MSRRVDEQGRVRVRCSTKDPTRHEISRNIGVLGCILKENKSVSCL